ncbi:MAG: sialoglycan-binding domain-containing protein, partial [Streptococcus mitis]|nr:sialoglycan-binding domain-containing protein [Streptococcus mitis]
MENKSNSLNRIKRQQREKVLRFSIRKYSFGAASVAVAALMFLGARVASADSLVDKTSQLNAGVVNPKNEAELPKESPDTTEEKVDAENQALTSTVNNAPTVDKAKLKKVVEELNVLLSTKLNLDESVVSPVKDRLQKGKEALESSELAQKDIDELVELLSKDVTVVSAAKEATEVQVDKQADKTEKPADNLASQTSPEVSASEESQTVSAKKDTLKVSVDQLQAAVLELPEHETSKEVLEKANELLGLAQGVLENTTVSLNDVEDMTKRVKRMFNSVKNATTRLTSGARDSRNGKSMGEGAQFRATTVEYGRVENALINVKEYISEAKGQGATTIGDRDRTISKTFMTAKYSEEGGKKFITYDVYFQNDGKALDGVTNNTFWFYPPRDILYNSGNNYPVGTIYESYYERYTNNRGTGTLSENPNHFTKVGDTYNIPLKSYKYQDSGARRSWNDRNLLYQLDGGPGRDNQRQEMLKNLKDNSELNGIIKSNGSYPGGSYSHILTISSHQNYAYKYHVKMRLRDNVTTAEAQKAGSMAVTTKAGSATNATAGYVYAGLGTRVVSQPDAPLDPIKGLTVTKTVGDPLGNPDDPANSGYVRHKENKPFPAGMNWSWQGNVKPTSTAKAGVFKYKVIARYQDGTSSEDKGSGSDGTVTLNVKPKQPTITTNVANKKGLPNQQITVNVGSGVPDGSTVNIYDGDTVIGTGTTKGETATVTVKGALPGKPITAKTVVTNNNGTVTSDKSKPVTPTEVPDNQKPQATLNGITLTETANTPIFTVYRGAEFNPELKVWDNSGKISKVTVGNLPSGVSASNFTAQTGKDGSSEDKKYKTRLSSGIVDTQTLGEYTATLHVEGSSATDSRDLKFKYRVVDIESKNLENGVAKVPVGSTLNVPNSRTNVDAHNYLKVVDSKDKADRGNSHLPQGMTWTWKSGDKLDPGTTLDNSGKYTRNATAQFPSSVTDNNSTTRTTFAPTEIKRPVVLAVTPTAPSVVANENGSVTVTPPTRPNGTTPQDIDTITLTYTPTGKTTPETVTVAKSGNNWTVNGKTTDKVSVTPAGVVTISDLEVADGKEVTAKVSKRIDNNVVLESPVAKVTSKSSKPAKPVAVAKDNGDVTGKPQDPAKADKITVSYTGEDNQPKTAVGKKDPKGKWTVNTPEVQINPNTGEITIPENKVKDGTEVTVVTKNGDGADSDPAKATAKFSKPAKPVATAKDNGDVTGKPQNPAKADKITVSYTGEDNQPKTAVGTKDPKGNWTVNTPEVQINPKTGEITIPDNKVKDGTEVTVVTKNGNSTDSDPAKAVAKDAIKPEATLNGVRLTENANSPIFTVYRGATFNPELKVWDNSGVISKVEVKGGLPKGVTASTFTSQTGKTEANPYATRLSSGTVLNTETLGEHEATLHVEGSSTTDSRDLKFKYRVVDIETRNLENGIAKVPVASTLNVANSGKNIDAHRYLKVVDSEDKADRGNNYLPSGMTWTWKAGDKLDSGTTLDNSGKYTRNATAVFPNASKNSITDVNSTTRTTFAPAEIKRQVVLAVTPTVPSVVGHENGSVTITPPTRPNSTNPQDIDTITITYVPTGKTTPETVTVTKSGNTWIVNGKTADKVSVTPAGVVTISDAEVADKTEITAKVSKRIDNVVLESPVARGTANGSLGAEVTPPAPVLEKEKTTPVTVVTPNKPGSTITTETPVNGLTVDGDGNLTGTPTVTDWGPKEEERKVTIPVKVKHGDEVVPVNVPVTIQRDTDGDGIPDKVDTDDDNDGIPDKDEEKNGTDPKTPTTQTPTIDITRKPNGDAVVTPKKPDGSTYPPGTKVEIPGEDGTPITVTIGDNGSGEVPNDKLPKGDLPGKGTVTEPNKNPSKPVEVTTPARKTPTVELEQDPDTGEVTVTPKKPDGTTYPPGTKVE